MKIAAKFLLLLYINLIPCFASESNGAKADDLYRTGQWAQAAEAYRAELAPFLQNNTAAAWQIYNFGTALFRAGSIQESYAYLLKAQFMSPLDADIRQNTKMVTAKISENAKKNLPATWLDWWPNELRTIPTIFWSSVALLFTALFLWKANSADNAKFLWLLGSILFFIITGFSYSQNSVPVASLLKDTKILSGPNSTFQEITNLPASSLVNVEEKRDAWLKIRFTDGKKETVGWLEAPTVLLIN